MNLASQARDAAEAALKASQGTIDAFRLQQVELERMKQAVNLTQLPGFLQSFLNVVQTVTDSAHNFFAPIVGDAPIPKMSKDAFDKVMEHVKEVGVDAYNKEVVALDYQLTRKIVSEFPLAEQRYDDMLESTKNFMFWRKENLRMGEYMTANGAWDVRGIIAKLKSYYADHFSTSTGFIFAMRAAMGFLVLGLLKLGGVRSGPDVVRAMFQTIGEGCVSDDHPLMMGGDKATLMEKYLGKMMSPMLKEFEVATGVTPEQMLQDAEEGPGPGQGGGEGPEAIQEKLDDEVTPLLLQDGFVAGGDDDDAESAATHEFGVRVQVLDGAWCVVAERPFEPQAWVTSVEGEVICEEPELHLRTWPEPKRGRGAGLYVVTAETTLTAEPNVEVVPWVDPETGYWSVWLRATRRILQGEMLRS